MLWGLVATTIIPETRDLFVRLRIDLATGVAGPPITWHRVFWYVDLCCCYWCCWTPMDVYITGNLLLADVGPMSHNRAPKYNEILMFVCLLKDAKQWCKVVKLGHTHCADR